MMVACFFLVCLISGSDSYKHIYNRTEQEKDLAT